MLRMKVTLILQCIQQDHVAIPAYLARRSARSCCHIKKVSICSFLVLLIGFFFVAFLPGLHDTFASRHLRKLICARAVYLNCDLGTLLAKRLPHHLRFLKYKLAKQEPSQIRKTCRCDFAQQFWICWQIACDSLHVVRVFSRTELTWNVRLLRLERSQALPY